LGNQQAHAKSRKGKEKVNQINKDGGTAPLINKDKGFHRVLAAK
jgi:hypothetical protein